MKTIESIKEQISAIVVFSATTLDKTREQYESILDRIYEGKERMKESELFTEGEIKDVYIYAMRLLGDRFRGCRMDIRTKGRAEFQF